MRGVSPSLLLVASVLAGRPEGSKADRAEEEIPIAIRLPEKRPILCTRIYTLNPEPESGTKGAPEIREELQFIDEHERIDSENEIGTRLFIKTWWTVDSEVMDPCLTGVLFKFRREGGRVYVDLMSQRRLPKRIVDDVLKQFSTLGIWAEFPEKARVGSSLKVNLTHLAPLLTTGKLAARSAVADVKFESLDDSGYAVFRGKARIEEKGELEAQNATMVHEGDCAIRTHPAGNRIASVTFEGRLRFDMPEGPRPYHRGGGEFKVELITEVGEAVEKARRQKPEFRERAFRLPLPPIALKLPSFYADVQEGEHTAYLRTRESSDGVASIGIQSTVSDKSAKEFFNEAEIELREEAELVSSEGVRSPLGEGRAFLLGSKYPDGKPLKMRNELYSIGQGRYVMYILVGSPQAFADALPEFEKARETLQASPVGAAAPPPATPENPPRTFQVEVTGSGKTMILIPGLGCSGAVWNETVRRFQDRYTCHVLTLAGFAGVPPVRGADPFLETVLKDLAKYIRDEDLGGCVILGHSLGAFLALALAAHEPDLPGKVIAVDGVPFSPALLDPEATVDTCRAQAELLKKAMDLPRPRELRRMEATPLVRGMLRSTEEADVVVRWIVDSDGPTLSRAFYESTITDLRPRMKDVRAPVLLLASLADMGPEQRDRLKSMHRKQLEAVRDARISFHETARHFILFDEPEWFFREVEAFIEPKVREEPPAKAARKTGAPRE